MAGVKKWLTEDDFGEFRNALEAMILAKSFDELNDSFQAVIPFGTGGRRGRTGVGPNRINFRTISESAQGLANYLAIVKPDKTERSAVIAYDTRHFSKEFAARTAEVFAGNGLSVYLFEEFRATPELSFAVRYLNADLGVVISASHNPPSDNGFKAYWDDGGQIVPPHDKNIIEEVAKIKKIEHLSFDAAERDGLLTWIGADIDEKYFAAVCAESVSSAKPNINIVYTSLHGTGTTCVTPVLKRQGYRVQEVTEQAQPDGDFPGVPNNAPNPEYPEALASAIDLARASGGDVVLATDPDADRLGVAVPKSADGQEWVTLKGNQIGALLTYYILTSLRDAGKLPDDGLVVKTAVTTDLISDICEDLGVAVKDDLLVGFKYIAEVIRGCPDRFIFGAEESHGYLKGTYARDKDAAVAAMLMADLTAAAKEAGQTPFQLLDELYCRYGYYCDSTESLVLEGEKGKAQIGQIMNHFRTDPPTELCGFKVSRVRDYLSNEDYDLESGAKSSFQGPSGDILMFMLSQDGRTRVVVRPSGTEPKIKFYISVLNPVVGELSKVRQDTDRRAAKIAADIQNIARKIVSSEN